VSVRIDFRRAEADGVRDWIEPGILDMTGYGAGTYSLQDCGAVQPYLRIPKAGRGRPCHAEDEVNHLQDGTLETVGLQMPSPNYEPWLLPHSSASLFSI
jgi:hypothetical protein